MIGFSLPQRFSAAGCIFANFIALCMGSSTLISEIILDDS